MRDETVRFVVLVFAVIVATTGCYRYVPVDVAAVTAGTDVRARVKASAAEQLGPSLGLSDARVLSGPVVGLTPDGMTLRVASVPAGTLTAPEGLFQEILINRSDLIELESRRLDEGRTRLAVVAGLAGAAALAATILRGRSSGESAVNEPPANFTLLHFRVGGIAPVLGVGLRGGAFKKRR